MKNMKYLFTGIFFMFFVGSVIAQDVTATTQVTYTVEQKTTRVVDAMTKVATLSPDQIEKITPFVTEFFKQKEIDLVQNKDNEELLNAAAKTRKENLVINLKTVLTGEQIELLKKYWEERNGKTDNTEIQVTE